MFVPPNMSDAISKAVHSVSPSSLMCALHDIRSEKLRDGKADPRGVMVP